MVQYVTGAFIFTVYTSHWFNLSLCDVEKNKQNFNWLHLFTVQQFHLFFELSNQESIISGLSLNAFLHN